MIYVPGIFKDRIRIARNRVGSGKWSWWIVNDLRSPMPYLPRQRSGCDDAFLFLSLGMYIFLAPFLASSLKLCMSLFFAEVEVLNENNTGRAGRVFDVHGINCLYVQG